MKKFIIIITVLCSILTSCNNNKIALLQESLKRTQDINSQLEKENQALKSDIEKLKETDQYYYQSGADEFASTNYDNAIAILSELKLKFPQSNLLPSADKIIRESKAAIAVIYQNEQNNLAQVINKSKKVDIEEAISLLTSYLAEDHPKDLKNEAEANLAKYSADYEKIKNERDLEHLLGVRLVDYSSGWGLIDFNDATMFIPQLRLVFKNITDYPLNDIRIKVDFITTSGNEVFGDASFTLISEFSGITLESGYSKTAYANCSVGYRNEVPISSVPELCANIYVNSKFYKKVPIKKGYRTK